MGLVPEYTTEAGRRAALGAGAKIVGSYSFELSEPRLREIEDIRPDIVLLTGGTDGGNKKVITHNAAMLARAGPGVSNIIVAGNKSAYDDVDTCFAGSDKNVIFTSNVMPEIGVLEVDAANHKIRDLFIARITEAKGIGRARSMIADVIMPTPAAVLEAAKLLADGAGPASRAWASCCWWTWAARPPMSTRWPRERPRTGAVRFTGLPEPYAKRTVEGDLGLLPQPGHSKSIADRRTCRRASTRRGGHVPGKQRPRRRRTDRMPPAAVRGGRALGRQPAWGRSRRWSPPTARS